MLNLYTALTTLIAVTKDRLENEEKGATAVEYGLMVGLIAVVIIVAVQALGVNLNVLFQQIVAALPG
jgi:pilus assembly protein Flp/PilA